MKTTTGRTLLTTFITWTLLANIPYAFASFIIPLSTTEQVNISGIVFRGVVVGQDCYRDGQNGQIYTRTSLRVIEPLKGVFPTIVAVVNPGGSVGDVAQ